VTYIHTIGGKWLTVMTRPGGFSSMIEETPPVRRMSEKELRARIDRVIAEEERTYGRLLELRDQLEAVIGELESSQALGPTARLPNISNIVAQPSRFRRNPLGG
jgi:hypothetical protein